LTNTAENCSTWNETTSPGIEGGRAIKPLFLQGPSQTVRFVLLSLLSIILMTVDHKQHYLETVRSGLSLLLYPVQLAVNLPFEAVDWAGSTLQTHRSLRQEREQLREDNLLLRAQLQKFTALENENMRLRELLESSLKVGDRVLIAEVVRVNLEPYTHQLILNKGSEHDVYRGQPLIDAHGVMGQITHVTPYSSSAMLITDPNHALPVQVNRSGLRSIAVGTGSFLQLDMLYIPINADVKVGDMLVTSGLGGIFPPGYPVGTVVGIRRDPGQQFARVVAEPSALLQRNREVLLVWKIPVEQKPAAADATATEGSGQ
jgi:rod shape-determining protein MreC